MVRTRHWQLHAIFSFGPKGAKIVSKRHFATNELKDAVFSLQMVYDCLTKVEEDKLYWKWVFVALHNALQGFMVTCLCPTNPYPVMQEAWRKCYTCPKCKEQFFIDENRNWGSREEWESWKGKPDKPPKPPRLLPFMDMYKRIKETRYMKCWSGSSAFKPKGSQTASVKRLNSELRNDFIHFVPAIKMRRVDDFVPVFKDVIGIISFLAFDSNTIPWVGQDDLLSKTKDLITSICEKMNELERIYAALFERKTPARS
jgi:hypothetical protein